MTDVDRVRRHLVKATKLDKVARIAYWQKLGTAAIFAAADELVRRHCDENGINPRLDRTIGFYQRGAIPKEK